jgi:hypothetical protein
MVAADASAYDPLDRYAHDIFIDDRPKDEDKMMLAGYLDRATKAEGLRDVADLLVTFPQVVDALPHIPGGTTKAAQKVFSLYKQHAEEVRFALERLVASHTSEMVYGRVGRGSLLRCMTDNCGIAAPVEAVTEKVGGIKSNNEPTMSEIDSKLDEIARQVKERDNSQQRQINELSAGPAEFLQKIGVKLSQGDFQLFALLVTKNEENGGRCLTYDQIAQKLAGKKKRPVSRQAIEKRASSLKAKNPGLRSVIDAERKSAKGETFSEISPTERRRAGVDESYGHRSSR